MPRDFRAPANAKSSDHERRFHQLGDHQQRLNRLGATFIWQQTQCKACGSRAFFFEDPNTESPVVGAQWTKRFLERHPEYFIRKQSTMDIDRKNAHDPERFRKWFAEFKKICDQHGIQPRDIYNFDETGFRIGIGKDQWVILSLTISHTPQPHTPITQCLTTKIELTTPSVVTGSRPSSLSRQFDKSRTRHCVRNHQFRDTAEFSRKFCTRRSQTPPHTPHNGQQQPLLRHLRAR
jgi:hypothetical protein